MSASNEGTTVRSFCLDDVDKDNSPEDQRKHLLQRYGTFLEIAIEKLKLTEPTSITIKKLECLLKILKDGPDDTKTFEILTKVEASLEKWENLWSNVAKEKGIEETELPELGKRGRPIDINTNQPSPKRIHLS